MARQVLRPISTQILRASVVQDRLLITAELTRKNECYKIGTNIFEVRWYKSYASFWTNHRKVGKFDWIHRLAKIFEIKDGARPPPITTCHCCGQVVPLPIKKLLTRADIRN